MGFGGLEFYISSVRGSVSELFCLLHSVVCVVVQLWPFGAWISSAHTNTEDLPYGKQSAGRGNEACVNSIVPAAFCLAASEETVERKKEGEEGVFKDDCHGRKGGGGCASVWVNRENAMC